MVKKPHPASVNQTAIGNDNIQVVGNRNVINRISNFFAGDTGQQRAMRNRRAMLELVKNTWIKGVLEKSLYNEVLIKLGKEERSRAVDHPWDMQIQMPNQTDRTLPAGSAMMDVYDGMNGAMLILGEPGSGKTTMLLELARDCIIRAEQDDDRPIPVIFNLSSWSDPKQSIDDWLTKELNNKYNVPKKTAKDWIENDDLQLLLDGLDEVKAENREACIKAINDFRQRHGLITQVGVCSRVADYEALKAKLNLSGAVLLQPLSTEQIQTYFKLAGSELDGVRQVLEHDELLQEMVKQPLILSILTLAYQGMPSKTFTVDPSDTLEVRRKDLFDIYIQQMFERVARTKNEIYTPEQTRHWLAWLAQNMIEHNQVPYYLENMQPKWLNLKQWIFRLFNALLGGLSGGLIIGIFGGLSFGLVFWLIGVLNVIFFPWINEELSGGPKLDLSFSTGLNGGLILGPFFGLLIGLVYGLALNPNKIEMVDKINWDWKKGMKGLMIGIVIGAMIFGLFDILITKTVYPQIGWMGIISGDLIIFMVSGGLIGGTVGGLIYGLFVQSINQTTYPLQRISLSLRNFLNVLLLLGPISGLVGGIFYWLVYGLKGQAQNGFIGLLLGLIIGLFFGPVGGLKFGGGAVLQHYVLRLNISIRKLLPWRLVPFLDYCTERIFLRKVGGGYIFVHRLLMEHFAALYPEET